jgi:hypothetical protein
VHAIIAHNDNEQECDDKATAGRTTAAQYENAMDECVQVCNHH